MKKVVVIAKSWALLELVDPERHRPLPGGVGAPEFLLQRKFWTAARESWIIPVTLPPKWSTTLRILNSRETATSKELLARTRQGDERALSALFRRHGRALRQWARGRLPKWARGVNDTADIVQDALLQTFRRIDRFEDRGKGALQAYLRQAATNRIRDEIRRVAHHQRSDLGTDGSRPSLLAILHHFSRSWTLNKSANTKKP